MDFFLKYKPYYSAATGSHTSAILLLRLMFWQDVMKGKEFSKPSVELQNECFLSRDIVKRELDRLQELGLITYSVKKFNNTPMYHFQVFNALIEKEFGKYENTIFVNSDFRKTRKSENTETKISKTRKSIEISKTRKSITEEEHKKTTEENIAEPSSADFPPSFSADLFGQLSEETTIPKIKTKTKKEPPPSPPKKYQLFNQFKDSYLAWYKDRFGVAHSFGAKEAGILAKIIDQLKQVLEADERIAYNNFLVILGNWDRLSKYYKEKPQLNLLLANLNSIINELKQSNQYSEHTKRAMLDLERRRGNNFATFDDLLANRKS